MRVFRSCVRMAAGLAALAILLVGAQSFAVPSQAFHLIDLGTLGGTESYAAGINNLGQVVGYSFTSGISPSSQRAFRTAPNSVINPVTDNLGTLGGFSSVGNAINDLGQVVGTSYRPDSTAHGFRTAPNAPINPATSDLGTLGGNNSNAWAINDLGEVAGNSFIAGNSVQRAFRTGPNLPILPTDDLGTLGGNESGAFGINNSGQVVGYSFIAGNVIHHAFRTLGRTPIVPATDDIGVAVGNYSGSYAINDAGQATGFAYFASSAPYDGFLTKPNAAINPATDKLGPISGTLDSSPRAVNSMGWVVGFLETSGVFERAFLHDGTTMVDLNNVLDAPYPGWVLQGANDVNDKGQIVGFGLLNGARRAFRLDPIPEPSAMSLMAAGVLSAFGGCRAGRRESCSLRCTD
jgi:probable HAF family extracellular repeat protein